MGHRPRQFDPRIFEIFEGRHDEDRECSHADCNKHFSLRRGWAFWCWDEDRDRCVYLFCSVECLFDAITPTHCYPM